MNALNEGWDVLSLYDIIHFDISESKKVSLQDIQLIGRGARYCPYKLPKNYKRDDDSVLSIFEHSTLSLIDTNVSSTMTHLIRVVYWKP